MLKPGAPIRQFMTSSVPTVTPETMLSEAREVMAANDLKHLPVVVEGRIVGLVSANAAIAMDEFGMFTSEDGPVESAMSREPATVPPDCPLRDVVHTMAHEDIHAVLVVEGAELQGMFSTTDAMKLLADALMG